jgi:hypothetical protein
MRRKTMTDFSKYVFGTDDDDRVAVYYKPTEQYIASFFPQEDTGITLAHLLETVESWERSHDDMDDTRWEDPRDTVDGLTDNIRWKDPKVNFDDLLAKVADANAAIDSLPTPFTLRLVQFLAGSNGRFRDKFTGQVAEYWTCDPDSHVVSLKTVGREVFIDISAGEFFSDWEATN